ncbi:MAG: autotransporter outer membrane beta-barrel domain-containing protein [Pseudomonadota bacterium]
MKNTIGQASSRQPNKAAYAPSLRGRLLQCAAASAAAWALVPTAAHAAIPPECDEEMDPNIVTCVVPAPDTVGQVDVTQDNTTIIIGDSDTPTLVETVFGDGVVLTGDGSQTIILGPNSSINTENGSGIVITGEGLLSVVTGADSSIFSVGGIGIDANAQGANGALNLNLSGDVSGQFVGIRLANQGIAAGDLVLVVNSGAQIRGFERDGIEALSISGDMTINATGASVRGGTNGINAGASTGIIDIRTGDVVGDTEDGIFLLTGDNVDDVFVDTTAGSITGRDDGIFIDIDAPDASLEVRTADVTGVNGNGIEIDNEGSSITLASTGGSISADETGILLTHTGSSIAVIEAANVTGAAGDGIDVTTGPNSSSVLINTVFGSVSGGENGISLQNNGSGQSSVRTANVSGGNNTAIGVLNEGTSLSINTTAGDLIEGAFGVIASNAGNSDLSITTAGRVIGNNGLGIFAGNSGTDVTIDTSAGSVMGSTFGIDVASTGTGEINITASEVTGTNNIGIFVRALETTTGVTIDTTTGSVFGGTEGIRVDNDGSGAVSVTTAGVLGETGLGIEIEQFGDGLKLDTSFGVVEGNTGGISAVHLGTGDLQIRTGQVIGGGTGIGLNAVAGLDTSNTEIDTSAGQVLGNEIGLSVMHGGSGNASIMTGDVSGASGIGLSALNGGVDMLIDTTAGAAIGGTAGIAANNLGSGSLTINTGEVFGEEEFGIIAVNEGTSLVIDSRAGAVSGGVVGIQATNDGSSSVSIATGDVTGTDSIGINVENNGLLAFIDTTEGTVTGGNEAIIARNNSGSLTVLTGNLNGLNSAGLLAENNAGSTFLTVDTRAGAVTAANVGVSAQNDDGTGALSVTTGDVTSVNSTGVNAINGANATSATVDTAAGSISSNFTGVNAVNDGSGDLSVTTADISSANGNGIRASNNNGGDLFVDSSAGSVTAAGDGIRTNQNGAGFLSVTTGNVNASGNAVLLSSFGGNGAVLNNLGVLTAGEFAILIPDNNNANVTINNDGSIVGGVSLGFQDDVLNNNMVFAADRDSFFGEGTDVFFNNGRLSAVGAPVFSDLELLNNSGTISLANAAFGDTLQLIGDYLGSGGLLELDVDLGGEGATDALIVDGAATGSTGLVLALDGQQVAFGNTTLVVDAGAGTSADAFALQGGNVVSQGFLSFGLSFDAANNDFLLGSAVGPAVFRTLKVGEGAQSVWYRSADAVDAHIDSARHSDTETRKPVWGQIYGSTSNRDDRFAFTSGGFTQDIALDYSQDYFGFQMGAEFGPGATDEGAFYGATAGYLSSDLGFDGLADGVRYDAFNLGLYAGYRKDGFFAHGLAKYDFINAGIDGQSVGYSAEVDGGSIGVRAEAGYRWESGSFFIEPSASLEYQSTNLDDFSALGADFDLATVDGLRGQAGARLGGESNLSNGSTLTYYASASAVHEFSGDGEITFSTPLSSATFVNNPIDTYARVDLGLNIATKGGVTGFIEGNADLSGDYSGFGGRAGLRIKF